MNAAYKPLDPAFYELVKGMVRERAGIRIQFYTAIHEFITIHATLKETVKKEDGEYLVLTTGEEIRLDRIVRLGDMPAPGYDENYFGCDIGCEW